MTGAPRALFFDVFGTVVDWYGSISAGVSGVLPPSDPPQDVKQFALDWRALYQPAMERIRSGARAYVPLDVLHRENAESLLRRHGLTVTGDDLDHMMRLWHRLDPWPDSAEGLRALRRIAPCAALSNGNIALMVNLSRHAGLTWDAILGAELAEAYKPDPRVYLRAAEAMDLAPADCMMVAAHNDDLRAARGLGMQTAFVLRAREYGPGQSTDLRAEEDWDVITASLTGLATILSA